MMSKMRRFVYCSTASVVALSGLFACPSDGRDSASEGEPCGPNLECEAGWYCFREVCRELCDSHRQCEKKDVCESGVCLPVADYECSEDAGCNEPSECESILEPVCYAGRCHYSPFDAGTPCDDGNACTGNDQCDAMGTCSGEAVQCEQPPASDCLPGDATFRQYASTGTCNPTQGGLCEYGYEDSDCTDCRHQCLGLPYAPASVTAVAGDARVVLSWEPVRDALSYDVYVSQTQGGTATAVAVPVSGSPYEQTGLTNGSTYYFAVSAVVDSGKGDLSSEVSATPRISAPGDVSAQGGVAEVTVSWSSVAGADAYDVYWADEAGVSSGSARARTAASPFVHGQRDDGTTYYYAVTAVDGSSESVLSAEVSATTASLPEVPQNLGAIAGDAQVTLTWDAVAGAQSHNVYVAESAGGTASALPIPAASSPHVQEDLNNGTTYYIAVSAVTQVGEGYLSAEVSATPRISMPEGVDAQGGDGQVTVTWEPVPGADSYNVYWALQPSVTRTSDQVSGVTTPFVHTSLAPYTTHYYAVTAVDGPSESVLSAEVSATTSPRPRHILAAYDASEADQFGYSVALSGDLAIMGARYDDGSDDSLPDAGAAYVFERTGPDTWDSGTKLVALDAQSEDHFGWSAAIDGDYAIVSAVTEDGGPDDPAIDAGAAYVFHRTGPNTWDSGVKLVAPDAQSGDRFGRSVGLSGGYAIVGAYHEDGGDGDPMSYAGAAYVFRRTDVNSWDQGTKLMAPDAQAGDWFGCAAKISGDLAIVGAYLENGGDGDPTGYAGAAYVFRRTGLNTWDAGVKLVAPDAQKTDWFGGSVALGGDYAIVGAWLEDGGAGNPAANAGAAYVFRRTGLNTWDAGIKLVAPDAQADDNFGWSVALSGDYAVVSAYREDGGDGGPMVDAGAAYLFHRTGVNTWDAGTKLVAPDAEADDWFGVSVALGDSDIIVGAPHEDGGDGGPVTDAGAAYIFQY